MAAVQARHRCDVRRPARRLGLGRRRRPVDRGILLGIFLAGLEHGRGALLHGGPCVDAGRERLEVDLDQRGPVDGSGLARRDDGSHRLARIEDALDRQRLVLPGGASRRQVSPGEHREHARRRSRGARLDAADPGAGQVAQDQLDVKQARHVEISRESGRPGDLFAALQPPPAHPDHAHRPIMPRPPSRAPGRQAPGTLRELDPRGV